jgi:glutathione S-transferase
LASHRYLAGDTFSIADITLVAALDFAKQIKVVEIPKLDHIERWYGEVNERPSMSAT